MLPLDNLHNSNVVVAFAIEGMGFRVVTIFPTTLVMTTPSEMWFIVRFVIGLVILQRSAIINLISTIKPQLFLLLLLAFHKP